MHLAFCDCPVVKAWVCRQVSKTTRRALLPEFAARFTPIYEHIEELRRLACRVACTPATGAYVVTELYKGEAVFAGTGYGFIERKSWAREAIRILARDVEMIAPTAAHFRAGEALWMAFCVRTEKVAFAGFSDYLDAALLLDPAYNRDIRHVVVGHAHIPYILRKTGFGGLTHVLGSGR